MKTLYVFQAVDDAGDPVVCIIEATDPHEAKKLWDQHVSEMPRLVSDPSWSLFSTLMDERLCLSKGD